MTQIVLDAGVKSLWLQRRRCWMLLEAEPKGNQRYTLIADAGAVADLPVIGITLATYTKIKQSHKLRLRKQRDDAERAEARKQSRQKYHATAKAARDAQVVTNPPSGLRAADDLTEAERTEILASIDSWNVLARRYRVGLPVIRHLYRAAAAAEVQHE